MVKHGPGRIGAPTGNGMTRRRRAYGWLSAIAARGFRPSASLNARDWRPALAVIAFVFACPTEAAAGATTLHVLDVPAGPVRESLSSLSAQTALTITLLDAAEHIQTPAVHGSLTAPAALGLLLEGTKLTFAYVGPTKVEVRRALGHVRWYDVTPGPALARLDQFTDTLGWDTAVDQRAAEREQTAGVHGCLSPDQAVRALLQGTSLTHEWVKDSQPVFAPDVRGLVIRRAGSSPWRNDISNQRMAGVWPQSQSADSKNFQCVRICAREGDPQPAETCVIYPESH